MKINVNKYISMKKNQTLYNKAKKIILGGNMLLSKRPEMILPNKWPTYFNKAKGTYVYDLSNKRYLDMMCLVGHNILGYANNKIDSAVIKEIKKSNMSTLNSPYEVYLAEKLLENHKWAAKCKFAKTGGEANTIAIRIARAATGRDHVAVCGYHGWHDWYLSLNLQNKKNLNTHLLPGLSTKGLPSTNKNLTKAFNYGDFDKLKKINNKNKLACVIMEVSRNSLPDVKFLKQVRKFTKENNIILIFDECTTGFRRILGGMHLENKINPDICMLGKAIGNGYPITVILGNKYCMSKAEDNFISSTFWSEKSGLVAALATINEMNRLKSWEKIINKGKLINHEWKNLANSFDLELEINGIESMTSFKFKSKKHLAYKTLISQELLKNQILASNMIFLNIFHDESKISFYISKLKEVFEKIALIELGKKKIEDELKTNICHDTFKRLN
jgi:glutamate-1-semialdehyde 2,1-aminomutase